MMEINTQEQEEIPLLDEMDEMAKCCIYTVPEFIKKGNEECYQPLVISIGPVFCNDPKLKAMQELKHIYLKCFIGNPNNACQSLEPYNDFVRKHEREIRKCYQKRQTSIPSEEFIDMIVLDAAFLIFLFWSNSYWEHHPFNNTERQTIEDKLHLPLNFIARDVLCVQENQLPLFVLRGMYKIAFGEGNLRFQPLTIIAVQYIESHHYLAPEVADSIINGRKIISNALSIKHLVHLQRECYCLSFSHRAKSYSVNPHIKTSSAKQLSAAGVKFKYSESDNLFDITFDKSSGVLQIPKLNVYSRTEALFRNILFFEQCHVHVDRHFTDYIYFLDTLIDSVEDVQILKQNEILFSQLGSDEDVVKFFNTLTYYTFFDFDYFTFSDVSKKLKDYSSTRWNRWKAILCQKYFNHPWAVISVVYAIILLILTLLQTISGFKS